MAVTNTGIVERVITGVNESDLWLDAEATSVVSNTGAVERSITGVHDANFVRPLGDEEVINGGFSDGVSNWALVGGGQETVVDGQLILRNTGRVKQLNVVDTNKTYIGKIIISGITIGSLDFYIGSADQLTISTNGTHTFLVSNPSDAVVYIYDNGDGWDGSIDSVSVKEVIVSRESTATNTGIVERPITGVNESDLWLDAESTSVVNNTGIVERPIVGVNESEEMFPDNTISNIVNIAGLISSLIADLKVRATTFENEDATEQILINLQKC